MTKPRILALTLVAVCLVACQPTGGTNPNVPAPTPAVNAMVGLWKPNGLPLRFKESVATLVKVQYQFNADKTYRFELATTWPSGADAFEDFKKPIAYDSFYEVDGRKLTVEIPDSLAGRQSLMLSPDGNSFTANVSAGGYSYAMTFQKQTDWGYRK